MFNWTYLDGLSNYNIISRYSFNIINFMKIPFSPPYIDEAVINEVVDSLRSGWITSGPKVKALEEEIKSFSGAKEVLCVNSWTSGAIMMLRWLGVKEGDEVIVPAYTYSATALAVLHAGAKQIGRAHV